MPSHPITLDIDTVYEVEPSYSDADIIRDILKRESRRVHNVNLYDGDFVVNTPIGRMTLHMPRDSTDAVLTITCRPNDIDGAIAAVQAIIQPIVHNIRVEELSRKR